MTPDLRRLCEPLVERLADIVPDERERWRRVDRLIMETNLTPDEALKVLDILVPVPMCGVDHPSLRVRCHLERRHGPAERPIHEARLQGGTCGWVD